MIYNLDANGYLPIPLEEILDSDGPQNQLDQLREALTVVQGMEPIGVGARDLRECLLLQIHAGMPQAEKIRRLVSDHLEDLAANRLPLIEKKTGYSIAEIESLLEQLHSLQPKPGAMFALPFVPSAAAGQRRSLA